MKTYYFLLVALLTLMGTGMQAQNNAAGDLASMDSQFIISLHQENEAVVAEKYQLDITSLDFQSAEELNQFCDRTSGGLHQFSGNFASKTLTLSFNTSDLQKMGMNTKQVNSYLKDVSRKLQSAYNDIKTN
ncbi:MAG: hypothetical protein AAF466_00380 [Bacteroidota bacterium]